jgi:hypothetical protein
MKCARCREWMHLNRPGELDAASALELKRHLAACPECREAAARAARSARTLERAAVLLRENPPVPSAGMTDRILAAGRKKERTMPFAGSPAARFFGARPARLSFALAASAAVLFFAGQEALVMSRVGRLENRMAVLSAARPAGGERLTELRSGFSAGAPDAEEWVAVRRSDLEALSGRYPDDPAVRSLIGRVERLARSGTASGNGAVRLEDVVHRMEKDPLVARWIKKMEKRGGTSWNRI